MGGASADDAPRDPLVRRADLPPLLETEDGSAVPDARAFNARRARIRRLLGDHFIGHFPSKTPRLSSARVVSDETRDDGTRRRRVELTWSTPRGPRSFEIAVWVPGGPGPHPVLLTQPRYYQIPWAAAAVARGYVVALYPGVDSHHREKDYPAYDSVWTKFREAYPDATWSEIATKAWLASRTLDYLLGPAAGYEVAEVQVGIIGFSRYGKQSMIAAAFDDRITSVVARSPGSPGSSPYRFTSRDTFAEAPSDFPSEWFLPSLRSFTGREHELPIDAHGWYALIAPRRCLVHTAHNDGSEPTFAVERAYLEGRRVYALLGYPERLRIQYRPGQHGPITPEHIEQNLDWLDLSFRRGDATQAEFPEALLHDFDVDAWQQGLSDADRTPPISRASRTNDERRRSIEWMLGARPGDVRVHSTAPYLTAAESQMMTHDRWAVPGVERIPIRLGNGVRGNAYIGSRAEAPLPVVIWLHPYSYHSGYNEGYGVQGTTVYHRLASEGFAVLAFDQCGFGLRLLEGTRFYEEFPRWSRLGRMVEDARSAIDLATGQAGSSERPLPPLDGRRVVLLGYSLGALTALHTAALDDRVYAVAAVSGWNPFRDSESNSATGGWAPLAEWHGVLPKLSLFRDRAAALPYDLGDALALIAPRPTLIYAARRDRTLDPDAVAREVTRARAIDAAASVTLESPDDLQRFQRDQHERFVRWFRSLPPR